jgi:hypothetical protein
LKKRESQKVEIAWKMHGDSLRMGEIFRPKFVVGKKKFLPATVSVRFM